MLHVPRRAPRAAVPAAPPTGRAPRVIAHRGACTELPEHTRAAFARAIRLGADAVEADVVMTADGVPVVRHAPELGGCTDVARRPRLAARRGERVIDGVHRAGVFAGDLTLAEMGTLRAVEPLPHLRPLAARHDGRFPVATLDDVLRLRSRLARELRRPVGVVIELKHPAYHASIGRPLERAVAALLRRHGLGLPWSPVAIQSFEPASLRALRRLTPVPLIQLVADDEVPFDTALAGAGPSYDEMLTPAGLAEVAGYAAAIAPAKTRVVPVAGGALGAPTDLVAEAHRAGLAVLPWTYRSENAFLPARLRGPGGPEAHGDARAEYRAAYGAGVDGVLTDDPLAALAARACDDRALSPPTAARRPAADAGLR